MQLKGMAPRTDIPGHLEEFLAVNFFQSLDQLKGFDQVISIVAFVLVCTSSGLEVFLCRGGFSTVLWHQLGSSSLYIFKNLFVIFESRIPGLNAIHIPNAALQRECILHISSQLILPKQQRLSFMLYVCPYKFTLSVGLLF